jgi:signal transduction histidine kinase/DNA-binding response OmpR family regulator
MQKKAGWITAPLPENEIERLQALRSYNILDTAPEEAFDRITRLASRLLKTPIALVSLVDENRQWFKSRHGLDAEETSRDLAFCAHAILEDKPLLVNNALKDERFYGNPLVADKPNIRFYAGTPLTDSKGFRLGTLCVIDTQVHEDVTEEDLSVLNDLAALVIDELELRVSVRKEQIANRHKTEFLANMSHEIRTPMNAIIGMANMLLDGNLHPIERGYAETVLQSSEVLLQIINDILDFSKIEAGKVELEHIPFDLQLICEEVCTTASIAAAGKKLDLLLRYPYGTSRYVFGDPGRVRQILINLVHNAIKFTEKGHVLLSVSPPVEDRGRLRFRIEVEDTGIGIPEDKTHYIFHKFNQADGSTTRKFGGTGLGLSISRELSEMMGGNIGVNSVLGKGSTFWCEILLREDKEASSILPSPKPALLKGLRVLVIDDTPLTRTILDEQLSPLGVNVQKAATHEEAFALLDNNEVFDVVIMDWLLPEMSGVELGKKLKARKPDMALIMLNSVPNRGDGRVMEKIGFAGYFAKPLTQEQLSSALAIIIEARDAGKTIPLITKHNLKETKSATQSHSAKILYGMKASILVAEDNSVNRLVAKTILGKYGFTPDFAEDGKQAVELASKEAFDIIFMDCQMPEMDGYEATQTIRQHELRHKKPHTPIVAFTANALKGDAEKCLAVGMDDYLSKPMRQEDLERVLLQWLKR